MSDKPTLAALIARSNKILVFTGAGISTGSGIPDFRGPNGVWKTRQPVEYSDFMSWERSRIEHWDFKLEGWPAFRDAQPNPAHEAVVKLEQAGKLIMVVTQNIDGLHTKAGTSDGLLVEIHGTNSKVECQSCFKLFEPDPVFAEFARTRKPPVCSCGGFLKPATISFGQNLRAPDLDRSERASGAADLIIALGSSLSVFPASTIPLIGARNGADYAIVNRGPTEHDGRPEVTLRLEGDVVKIFPKAVDEALG